MKNKRGENGEGEGGISMKVVKLKKFQTGSIWRQYYRRRGYTPLSGYQGGNYRRGIDRTMIISVIMKRTKTFKIL